MKKLLSLFLILIICLSLSVGTYADNPVVQADYTADPAPLVASDGRLYLYVGHDNNDGNDDSFNMSSWMCYSTTDMQNWTDHGVVMYATDFEWAEENSSWAAQCIEFNGKYYLYVTVTTSRWGGGRAIGVAVSDSPTGPFVDALGEPLCGPNWLYIDPTVFIDDDGQGYIYFGNPRLFYAKLGEDMLSIDGDIIEYEMDYKGFCVRTGGDDDHKTYYEEGPWVYKRDGIYYLVYAAMGIPEAICYSTSDSPVGPWTYQGMIMDRGTCQTIHPGIVDYKGHSYFFYHGEYLEGAAYNRRTACVEEFTYSPDGSIPLIEATYDGPAQLEYLNPFEKTEAETICFSQGIETEVSSQGGMCVTEIEKGDYVKVKGVDFSAGANEISISLLGSGSLDIRIDSQNGKKLGTITCGSDNWSEIIAELKTVEGIHDLYFVGRSGSLSCDYYQFAYSENVASVNIFVVIIPIAALVVVAAILLLISKAKRH